ncbi:glycine oxidase [Bathymodiolus japonicus methanotrophic gill symbiont]|uniref:NAD(P)/FAD-dependent oxidoreductase n=1 Tax=Bathymodiolus japonicus methanotrophic gill symbiont TaxID=113269 RepID=UPI001B4516BD|nr:FAD-binding oxidoreductase [Bathymodiolus japonicus methanotrophic gill symbiont]GFO73654.1 glycine oxidase [Bathymodiolus japonicus methanotrophic gill symbiont]
MSKQVDYLIIGQGLAGSILSWELIKQGCTVHLVDNQQENASQIAAGLINPITGMRLVKHNKLDTLLPCAKQTYQELSQFFSQDFYIEKPMLRILRNEKELLKFQQRIQEPAYHKYLDTELKSAPAILNAPLGIIQQQQTGYLLTQNLLACLKNFLQAKQAYQRTQFVYQDLNIDNAINWQGITAKKVIFCEGYLAIHNPWFKHLAFQLAKGEILTLTTQQTLAPELLNYGHWLIPINKHQFRTGATFDTINLNTQATDLGKSTLLHALAQTIPTLATASIDKHQANIRPTTLDKMPFIGLHPKYQNLAIFNGFGAKGSLQIPYYSQHFVQHLLHKAPIAPEINSQRFSG